MTRDTLDDLLERSAPATRAADEAALSSMIAEASREVPRGRKRRGALLAGALAVVLVGTAGVATATDGFSWAPWIADPVGAVPFTMSNGFECELRFTRSQLEEGASGFPGAPIFLDEVNGILEDWYRTTDVAAEAKLILPEVIEHWDLGEVRLELDETAETLPDGEYEHREFIQEWMAWEFAIRDLEMAELARHGISPEDERFQGSSGGSQIQCLDESGDPYSFGAGS